MEGSSVKLVKHVEIEKAQNFMRQFRDAESTELKKLSANQFMDVWSHYDFDGKQLYILYLHYKSFISNLVWLSIYSTTQILKFLI